MPLFLTEDDVRDLIDMPASVGVVEEVFRRFAFGEVMNVPRTRARATGIVLHAMSAAAEYLGLIGWKAYTTTAEAARFHVAVYDINDGRMIALIEADHLGRLRTGAATGVATRHMARETAETVGLFGSGKQARTQLQAVCAVREITRVEVYSRNEERRRSFAGEMSRVCETDVTPAADPAAVAAGKDILITATSAKTPLFDGNTLAPGTHVNAIGSNFWQKAEIDVATVRRAETIACDSIEQCRIEAGDFREAIAHGVVTWDDMQELSAIVAGHVPARFHDESITLFKSVGLAIEDVALAAAIIERAREAGVGRELPF